MSLCVCARGVTRRGRTNAATAVGSLLICGAQPRALKTAWAAI